MKLNPTQRERLMREYTYAFNERYMSDTEEDCLERFLTGALEVLEVVPRQDYEQLLNRCENLQEELKYRRYVK